MPGLVIVLIVVGSMIGMGIERKHPTKPEPAKTEQVVTVKDGDVAK